MTQNPVKMDIPSLSQKATDRAPSITMNNTGLRARFWPHYPLLQSKHGLESVSKVFKDNLRPAIIVACVSLPLSASLGVAML